jgi:hypothetical protein
MTMTRTPSGQSDDLSSRPSSVRMGRPVSMRVNGGEVQGSQKGKWTIKNGFREGFRDFAITIAGLPDLEAQASGKCYAVPFAGWTNSFDASSSLLGVFKEAEKSYQKRAGTDAILHDFQAKAIQYRLNSADSMKFDVMAMTTGSELLAFINRDGYVMAQSALLVSAVEQQNTMRILSGTYGRGSEVQVLVLNKGTLDALVAAEMADVVTESLPQEEGEPVQTQTYTLRTDRGFSESSLNEDFALRCNVPIRKAQELNQVRVEDLQAVEAYKAPLAITDLLCRSEDLTSVERGVADANKFSQDKSEELSNKQKEVRALEVKRLELKAAWDVVIAERQAARDRLPKPGDEAEVEVGLVGEIIRLDGAVLEAQKQHDITVSELGEAQTAWQEIESACETARVACAGKLDSFCGKMLENIESLYSVQRFLQPSEKAQDVILAAHDFDIKVLQSRLFDEPMIAAERLSLGDANGKGHALEGAGGDADGAGGKDFPEVEGVEPEGAFFSFAAAESDGPALISVLQEKAACLRQELLGALQNQVLPESLQTSLTEEVEKRVVAERKAEAEREGIQALLKPQGVTELLRVVDTLRPKAQEEEHEGERAEPSDDAAIAPALFAESLISRGDRYNLFELLKTREDILEGSEESLSPLEATLASVKQVEEKAQAKTRQVQQVLAEWPQAVQTAEDAFIGARDVWSKQRETVAAPSLLEEARRLHDSLEVLKGSEHQSIKSDLQLAQKEEAESSKAVQVAQAARDEAQEEIDHACREVEDALCHMVHDPRYQSVKRIEALITELGALGRETIAAGNLAQFLRSDEMAGRNHALQEKIEELEHCERMIVGDECEPREAAMDPKALIVKMLQSPAEFQTMGNLEYLAKLEPRRFEGHLEALTHETEGYPPRFVYSQKDIVLLLNRVDCSRKESENRVEVCALPVYAKELMVKMMEDSGELKKLENIQFLVELPRKKLNRYLDELESERQCDDVAEPMYPEDKLVFLRAMVNVISEQGVVLPGRTMTQEKYFHKKPEDVPLVDPYAEYRGETEVPAAAPPPPPATGDYFEDLLLSKNSLVQLLKAVAHRAFQNATRFPTTNPALKRAVMAAVEAHPLISKSSDTSVRQEARQALQSATHHASAMELLRYAMENPNNCANQLIALAQVPQSMRVELFNQLKREMIDEPLSWVSHVSIFSKAAQEPAGKKISKYTPAQINLLWYVLVALDAVVEDLSQDSSLSALSGKHVASGKESKEAAAITELCNGFQGKTSHYSLASASFGQKNAFRDLLGKKLVDNQLSIGLEMLQGSQDKADFMRKLSDHSASRRFSQSGLGENNRVTKAQRDLRNSGARGDDGGDARSCDAHSVASMSSRSRAANVINRKVPSVGGFNPSEVIDRRIQDLLDENVTGVRYHEAFYALLQSYVSTDDLHREIDGKLREKLDTPRLELILLLLKACDEIKTPVFASDSARQAFLRGDDGILNGQFKLICNEIRAGFISMVDDARRAGSTNLVKLLAQCVVAYDSEIFSSSYNSSDPKLTAKETPPTGENRHYPYEMLGMMQDLSIVCVCDKNVTGLEFQKALYVLLKRYVLSKSFYKMGEDDRNALFAKVGQNASIRSSVVQCLLDVFELFIAENELPEGFLQNSNPEAPCFVAVREDMCGKMIVKITEAKEANAERIQELHAQCSELVRVGIFSNGAGSDVEQCLDQVMREVAAIANPLDADDLELYLEGEDFGDAGVVGGEAEPESAVSAVDPMIGRLLHGEDVGEEFKEIFFNVLRRYASEPGFISTLNDAIGKCGGMRAVGIGLLFTAFDETGIKAIVDEAYELDALGEVICSAFLQMVRDTFSKSGCDLLELHTQCVAVQGLGIFEGTHLKTLNKNITAIDTALKERAPGEGVDDTLLVGSVSLDGFMGSRRSRSPSPAEPRPVSPARSV